VARPKGHRPTGVGRRVVPVLLIAFGVIAAAVAAVLLLSGDDAAEVADRVRAPAQSGDSEERQGSSESGEGEAVTGSAATIATGSPDFERPEVPAGAVAPSTQGGAMREASEGPLPIVSADCQSLLSATSAEKCVSASGRAGVFALTLTRTIGGIQIDGYRLDSDGSPSAQLQARGFVVVSSLGPGENYQVSLFAAPTYAGEVLGINAVLVGPTRKVSTVELLDANSAGVLRVSAVFSAFEVTLLEVGGSLLVVSREGASDSGRATALYPESAGWLVVPADPQVPSARSVSFGSSIVLVGPPVPTEPPVPDFGWDGQFVDGYYLPCDGSWLAIVSSVTAAGAPSTASRYPGSSYVRNEDACESLNPTFSTGSNAGQAIYVVFYGPYFTLAAAQQQCRNLGFTTQSQCYAAPLTNNPADRRVRYGP
jgi:hypothetical protein